MISKQNKAIKEIQTTFHSQDIETKVQYNINVKPYIQNKVRRYGLGRLASIVPPQTNKSANIKIGGERGFVFYSVNKCQTKILEEQFVGVLNQNFQDLSCVHPLSQVESALLPLFIIPHQLR
jgi:acetate kinase